MGFIDKLLGRSDLENSSTELSLLKTAEKKIRSTSPQLGPEASAYYIVESYFRSMCPGFAEDQPVHLLDSVLANGQIEKPEISGPRLRKLIDDSFPLLAEQSVRKEIRVQLAENLWVSSEFATPIDGQKAIDTLTFFFANASEKQILDFLDLDENLEFARGGIEAVMNPAVSIGNLINALDQAAIRVPQTNNKRIIASFAEDLSDIEQLEKTTSSENRFCSQCGSAFGEGAFCTSCGSPRT
jgi:hypothetical protein